MKLILEAIKSLLRFLQNSIRATQGAVANVMTMAEEAQTTADNAKSVADEAKTTADAKMDRNNPVGTGSFSMNRLSGSIIGEYSHAEGYGTVASGKYSHAEGMYTTASGEHSHTEGMYTTASGKHSHTEGMYTIATDAFAHAEGQHSIANGQGSHAEGSSTQADGSSSHAEGQGTIATSWAQHVQGRYNIIDTSGRYAHIIGNGMGIDNRANIHTLDWNGLGWFAGGLKVGGTGQDDANAKEVATKDDKLPNPNALIFTGAVEGTYDGSAPLTVEIPQGGSGGETWEFINTITIGADTPISVTFSADSNGNAFALKKFYVITTTAPKATYLCFRINGLNWAEQFSTGTLSGGNTSANNPIRAVWQIVDDGFYKLENTNSSTTKYIRDGEVSANGGKQSHIESVNSITIAWGASANFAEGDTFTLYGVKA